MDPPRFLADEMLGRLARYLRFVGCDTVYAHGWEDAEIAEAARKEERILLTRDRALARRSPGALLLTTPEIGTQWKAVVAAFPAVPRRPDFLRCPLCNGRLAAFRPDPGSPRPPGVPWTRVDAGLPLFRCEDCAHLYWPGSHTDRIAETLRRWTPERIP